LNADETASKSKVKKVKNARKATTDDNDGDAGKKGWMAKPAKKMRVKNPGAYPLCSSLATLLTA
jgi:hypothetical protein